GPDDPRVALALGNLGTVALDRHQYDQAARQCERGVAIDEKVLGRDHPDLAFVLGCLGEARLGAGDARAAVEALERAASLSAHADPADLRQLGFALARSLWASGARERARSVADQARAAAGTPAKRAAIDRWRATH